MVTKEILESYSVRELKKEISKRRMKNYSHLKKADLHDFIIKNKSKFMDLKKKEKKIGKVKKEVVKIEKKVKKQPKKQKMPNFSAFVPGKKIPTPKPKISKKKKKELNDALQGVIKAYGDTQSKPNK
jgi:hypothetical protein